MKVIVLSVGGSLIIPDNVDVKFLERLKKTLRKHYKNNKFVIVCGGGSIARTYINALKKEHRTKIQLSLAGIRATRMNAQFVMQFFGEEANIHLPRDMHEVKGALNKNNVVVCGALRWSADSTSDTTAAKLAHYLKTKFINLTNVSGLYSADPKKDKNAKFIAKESWKDFEKRAHAIKHTAGQHFILDQQASTIIRKHKISTYILGKDLSNLENVLNGKSFKGTLIANGN